MKETPFHPSSRKEDEREQKFTALFEKHSDELFRHAYFRLSDRERALDITQETFLRTLAYLRRGEDIQNHRAFLYRILNNLIIDEYRRSKSQSLDALLDQEDFSTAAHNEFLRDPLDMMEEAMVRFDSARALDALKELPEPYRAALVYRYIDGLSVAEVSHATGENENVLSVRIHRALKKLRKILENPTP